MSEEEKKEEMYKLFQDIYKMIAKELLVDLDKDSLDEEKYDEDNEDHQKYFRFFEWIQLLTIIVRQQKIGVLRLIRGYFKRKELRPKLRHVMEHLIHKVSEEEIALFEKVGIILSERQKNILENLSRSTHSKKHHIDRAKIILLSSEHLNNSKISRELGIHRVTVRKWRYRWLLAMPSLSEIEEKKPHKLRREIYSVLEDAYRSGAPSTFQPEQVATIIATAIRSPTEFGKHYLSQWTLLELKNYLEEEEVVQTISTSSLSRLLNQFDIKPHRMEYYLNPEIEDEEEFKKQVKYLCMLYQTAEALSTYGIEVICLDEMTGIQALEHRYPVRPIKPGQPMKVETKYKRNGTTGILGARSVVSGLITAIMQKKGKRRTLLILLN